MENVSGNNLHTKKRHFPLKRGGKYYIEFNGKPLVFPSVTTILGNTIPKTALIYWAAKTAAQAVLDDPSISVEDAAATINQKRDKAGDMGSLIHSWAEAYGNGQVLDPEVLPIEVKAFGYAFKQFIDVEQPEILYTECIVFSPLHGYAGTADLIARTKDKKIALFDYKTGKATYFEAHLQQEAYANAEFIYTKDRTILPMPKIEEKYLVHLKSNGKYSLIGVNEPFQSFLATLAMYKILEAQL